jgi:hypothetical protein
MGDQANGGQAGGAADRHLIAADQLEGTLVHAADGTRLGVICGLMIDRVSGQVAYAILSLSGVGDLGRSRVPLPWSRLRFDAAREAHVLVVSAALLKGAPRSEDGAAASWTDRDWTRRIDRHYAGADGHGLMPPHGL